MNDLINRAFRDETGESWDQGMIEGLEPVSTMKVGAYAEQGSSG